MIPIIVISLLFVLLIVFCVVSAKNWHWSNIVFLILCYIAGVAACIGLSQVLDRRTKALALVKDTEERLNGLGIDSNNNGIDDLIDADIKGNGPDNDNDGISDNKTAFALANQADYVIFGSPNSPSYSPTSLRGLNELVALQDYGRGRVWNGVPSAEGDNRVFQFAKARQIAPENQAMVGVELHIFRDTVVKMADGEDQTLPTSFIGSMVVIAETPESLTLEPEFIVNRRMFEELDEVTWSLYEKMPADRHDIFTTLIKDFDPSSDELKDSQITKYREALQRFLPAVQSGFDVNNADNEIARNEAISYERFIDKICFDGMGLKRIESWIGNAERVSGDFKPDPEEEFVKYEFTADSDFGFQVDGEGDIEDGAFSLDGQAIDKSLHNDGQKDVRFKKGDIVLIDSINATNYVRQDGLQVKAFEQRQSISVVELDRIFVRKLFDFPQILKDFRAQSQELAKSTAELELDIVVSQKTLANVQAQGVARDDILAKLEQDRDNLTQDVAMIAQLLEQRQQEVEELMRRIQQLENEIRTKREALK